MSGAICAPAPVKVMRRFYWCRRCERRRLHDLKIYEWYGPHAVCRTCKTLVHFEE
jgi:hypothetical protein